jgi:hypothetical protein
MNWRAAASSEIASAGDTTAPGTRFHLLFRAQRFRQGARRSYFGTLDLHIRFSEKAFGPPWVARTGAHALLLPVPQKRSESLFGQPAIGQKTQGNSDVHLQKR